MTAYRRGDVVLVRFPFADLRGSKQRPGLMVSTDAYERLGDDAIVLAISSHRIERPGPYDHLVENWKRAGLLGPSVVRAGKVVTVERSLIRRHLGSLDVGDLAAVDRLLMSALGLERRTRGSSSRG